MLRESNFSLMNQQQNEITNVSQAKDLLKNEITNIIRRTFRFVIQEKLLFKDHLEGIGFIISIIVHKIQEKKQYDLVTEKMKLALKDCYHQAILARSIRLIQPMYTFILQLSTKTLGVFYLFLQRYKGYIIKEKFIEETTLFKLKAQIPVIESLGFVNELRNLTFGSVTTQLSFSGWKLLGESKTINNR